MPVPARAVTWASWPSTHTAPSRSTHSAILRATVRTGHGCSGEVGGVTPSWTVVIRLVSIVTNGGRSPWAGLPRQQRPQVVEREEAQPAAQLRDRHLGYPASAGGPVAASTGRRRRASALHSSLGVQPRRSSTSAGTSSALGTGCRRAGRRRRARRRSRPAERAQLGDRRSRRCAAAARPRRTSPSSASPRPGRSVPSARSPLMASSVTFCCTRIEACSAWLTAVTGNSTTSRGRSRACSTAVATRPAAIRTGSGSGFMAPSSRPRPGFRRRCGPVAPRGTRPASEPDRSVGTARTGWRPCPDRAASASCWPSRAATAPASTGPWRPSSGRWSSTAPRSTCASRSCTTCTSWRPSPSAARSSSTRPTRCRRARSSCSPRTASSPAVRDAGRERELRTIDATCPLVTKVHQEAKRFAREDYDILLVGHDGHEEVEGTAGEAPEHIQLVETAADVADGHRARPGEGRVAVPDHAVGRRDDGDGRARCASASRRCRTRRATTSATPRRTARSR